MRLKSACALILVFCLALGPLSACDKQADARLKVFCTLFPQYDFARQIGGDKLNLIFMLEPGQDYRSHKPGKAQIKKYAACDIFIYTNDIIEPWVLENLDLLKSKGAVIVNACDGAAFDINLAHDEHTHKGEDHSDHEHGLEPHVWTNPLNAALMAENVGRSLIVADPDNAKIYRANLEVLKGQLLNLDALFSDALSQNRRKPLVMADRFTLQYFTMKYSVGYLSAISSCAQNSAPSPETFEKLAKAVKSQNISYVFYRELSDKSIALKLSEETGAIPLLFHSCENLSSEEWEAGNTFVSLMQDNAKNLKTAFS
ncbi:MAG TPA: metal ABC transporter substrate-binding protein [Clostridiales bacterium]|jgi:zinc transport system substrate-binding protein|nr:metal ABC transporter substrate-binding protein [Clostridiales bacterium]